MPGHEQIQIREPQTKRFDLRLLFSDLILSMSSSNKPRYEPATEQEIIDFIGLDRWKRARDDSDGRNRKKTPEDLRSILREGISTIGVEAFAEFLSHNDISDFASDCRKLRRDSMIIYTVGEEGEFIEKNYSQQDRETIATSLSNRLIELCDPKKSSKDENNTEGEEFDETFFSGANKNRLEAISLCLKITGVLPFSMDELVTFQSSGIVRSEGDIEVNG